MAVTIGVPGAEPAVLFIHGFPLDRALWRHQTSALPGWRCVAPDLRGAGESSAPADRHAYTMARYAEDLVALLDDLRLRETVACGLSMGGYVLFELLRRHAPRIRAAIFCNTKAEADSDEAKRGRDAMIQLAETGGAAAVAEAMLPKMLAPATHALRPDVVREVRTMIARAPVPGIVGALHALRERPDSTATLPTIRVPALVVAGSDDQITPASGMRALAARIPAARFVEIADAGHLTPLEQPARLNEALREFLKAVG
ncbi:MAG: alpha/beta fold hydrolase [Gemmatimonadales bacterium]